jgi:hypothetical protein
MLSFSTSQHVSAPLGHPQVNHSILVILSYESHRYFNGSVVPNFTNGKYVLFTIDSQLRCRYMSDRVIYIYIYIM